MPPLCDTSAPSASCVVKKAVITDLGSETENRLLTRRADGEG